MPRARSPPLAVQPVWLIARWLASALVIPLPPPVRQLVADSVGFLPPPYYTPQADDVLRIFVEAEINPSEIDTSQMPFG